MLGKISKLGGDDATRAPSQHNVMAVRASAGQEAIGFLIREAEDIV